MDAGVRLDTHVVVWLYAGETNRLSRPAIDAIESSSLYVSPIVGLELTFLNKIGRLSVHSREILDDLRRRIGLEESGITLAESVAAAIPLDWTRDPFDRMIVGDTIASNGPLVTKDGRIREHFPAAVW